jgi:hypothetical protein
MVGVEAGTEPGAGYQCGGMLCRDTGAVATGDGNEGGDGLPYERRYVPSGCDGKDDAAGIRGRISFFKCECEDAVGIGIAGCSSGCGRCSSSR